MPEALISLVPVLLVLLATLLKVDVLRKVLRSVAHPRRRDVVVQIKSPDKRTVLVETTGNVQDLQRVVEETFRIQTSKGNADVE